MKKENNKAFTLIELLAVFVILAIIAIITVPIVLNTIKHSRNQSYKRSVEGYAHAIENGLSDWQMMNPGKAYSNYDYSNITTKGNSVTCDNKKVYSNGKIALSCCYTNESKNNNQYYNYTNGKVSASNTCDAIDKQYELLDEVSVYGENYIVIGNNTTSTQYVTLLKTESIGKSKYYENETCSDEARNSGNISNCNNNYAESIVKGVIDNWKDSKFPNNELVEVSGYRARLLNIDDLTTLGYSKQEQTFIAPSDKSLPSWVGWTMISSNNSTLTYRGVDKSSFSEKYIFESDNVHPVINIKTTYVE